MVIIGISGKKRTGKTTVAEYIKSVYPHNKVHIISFADALKEEVAQRFNTTVAFIDAHKDNFRLILQGVGTDYRRKLCGEDYWRDRWLEKVIHLCEADNNCIVVAPDVRFVNEAKAILKVNGILWRITKPDIDIDDQHPSEIELDRWTAWDAIINNYADLVTLKANVQQLLKDFNVIIK